MKEPHRKGVANHPALESYAGDGNLPREALTGAHAGQQQCRGHHARFCSSGSRRRLPGTRLRINVRRTAAADEFLKQLLAAHRAVWTGSPGLGAQRRAAFYLVQIGNPAVTRPRQPLGAMDSALLPARVPPRRRQSRPGGQSGPRFQRARRARPASRLAGLRRPPPGRTGEFSDPALISGHVEPHSSCLPRFAHHRSLAMTTSQPGD